MKLWEKFWEFFDYLIAFTFGIAFTMFVSCVIYGAGNPRIVIIAVISAILCIFAAFVAYCLGKRRAKAETLVAYNKGIERGITLGRAEIINEHQQLVEFDN